MGMSFSFGVLCESPIGGTDKKLCEYAGLIEFDRRCFNELGYVVARWMCERGCDPGDYSISLMTQEVLDMLFKSVQGKTILFQRGDFESYKKMYRNDLLYRDCRSDKEIVDRFHDEISRAIHRMEELSRESEIYFQFST